MKHLPVRAWNEDACWRRIGVAGDRTCPELAQHVHCRNCPVYAGAAHGWCVKGSQVYKEDAAERAWAELQKLYKSSLA